MPDAELARRFSIQNAADLAVWNGDFSSAETSLRGLQTEEASLAEESKHLADWQLIYVYEEEGDGTKAANVGEAFLRTFPAWVHDEPTFGREAALGAQRRAGRVSDAQAQAMREAWNQEWRPLLHARTADARSLFFDAWVETPSEARGELRSLPSGTLAVPLYGASAWAKGIQGRVYALAGDADHAIPLLRAGAARCGEIPFGDRPSVPIDAMMDQMHDRFLLGQMLELKDDRDAACAQYGAILSRWKGAKPRSITLDKARARRSALRCP